jgi:xeroderma pigmentosum group C-complementing protein
MAGKQRVTGSKGKAKATTNRNGIPDVYQEMLAEALPAQSELPDRPLKRRRTGRREGAETGTTSEPPAESEGINVGEDEDEDVEFEDVLGGDEGRDSENESDSPPKRLQTAYRDSDDDSAESDFEWEALDFDANAPADEPSGDLELTLTTRDTSQKQKSTPRRKAVTKAERVLRLEVHKMHVLCLLAHADRRNDWCNDTEVHSSLKPLLDKKMLQFLRPKSDLSQFGRAESLKRGIDQVSTMWRKRFTITARGIRRGLWADDEKDIQNVKFHFYIHEMHC